MSGPAPAPRPQTPGSPGHPSGLQPAPASPYAPRRPTAAPGGVRAWVLAARVPTLSAAVAPVLVGAGAALRDGAWRPGVWLATLAASVLIQIGTNFANDLFDFRKGADTGQRLGPTRATQAGLLTERQMALGTVLAFGLAVLVGAYLARVGGWPIVAVGAAAIAAGVLYTAGPWPLGYHGLGDLFVFIFFGVAAVCGTYYLQAGTLKAGVLAASVPVGLTVTNILVVNNLRDIETDRAAGKRTLAVRVGASWTRRQYGLFLGLALAAPLLLWKVGQAGPAFWLPWLALPEGVRLARRVARESGPALNRVLKETSRFHLLYGALLGASMLGGSP